MHCSAPKIFGIGLSKTGTSSLARALEILGFRTKDYLGISRYAAGDLSSVDLQAVDAHDALTDTPIPSFFRELDARYPGSKFILTVRSRESWLQSCKKQFTPKLAEKQNAAHKQLFLDLYGTDVYDEQKFVHGYARFLSGVKQHFAGRPNDLLILDIAAGEGWERLCAFLGKPVPDVPFPKANVTHIRWLDIAKVVAVARDVGREVLRGFGNTALPTGSSHPAGHERTMGPRIAMHFRRLDSVIGALKGGSGGTQGRALNRARKSATSALHKLTPQIPVLVRGGKIAPQSERVAWNHVWLVDVLGSDFERWRDGTLAAVTIALVEDGRAICGVVYIPSLDIAYYGNVGQGAFVVTGDGPPVRIEPRAVPPLSNARLGDVTARFGTSGLLPAGSQVIAHAIAARLSAGAPVDECAEVMTEWDTAAATAIANAIDVRLVERETGRELAYNTPMLSVPPFRIA